MSDRDIWLPRGKPIGWWVRRVLVAVTSALAVYLLVLIVLNYQGFCFKERRLLSDQEKFRMVVGRMVTARRPFWPVSHEGNVRHLTDPTLISHWIIKGHDGPVEPIFYRSAEEFFDRNPDCCEMRTNVAGSEGPFEPDFWDRALGDCSGGVVRITGTFRFRDQAGIEREIRDTGESLLSNCGTSLDVPF